MTDARNRDSVHVKLQSFPCKTPSPTCKEWFDGRMDEDDGDDDDVDDDNDEEHDDEHNQYF